MRELLIVTLVLNVCALWGQTFNRRYDLLDLGNAQTVFGIERAIGGGHILFQASADQDTIDPGNVVSITTIGLTWLDGSGDRIYQRRLKTPGFGLYAGWANCCDSVDGGFIVGAGRNSYDGVQDVLLIRFDTDGDTLWTRSFGGSGQSWIGRQVKHTLDGGFIVVGETDATGYIDAFAIKTDADGNEEWRRTYGVGGQVIDGFLSVITLPDGDLVLGGSRFTTTTTHQYLVIRTDPMGEPVWTQLWGSGHNAPGAHLASCSDGGFFVSSAWAFAPNYVQDQPYLAKIDPVSGDRLWEGFYGPRAPNTTFFAGKEVPNGDLIAAGVSYAGGPQKGVLLRTTAAGDSLWMRSYFYTDDLVSAGVGRFYDVLPTVDGGFIATGAVYGQYQAPNPPGYSQDAWVVKVDGYGCLVPGCNSVGITEQATNLLDALSIYPNPVQAGTPVTLQLSLPASLSGKALELTVVAMDGRVVQRERVPNGNGSFTLSLSHLSPGLYHLHIASGNTWLTGGKLVVE